MTKLINLTPHLVRIRVEASDAATPLESDIVLPPPAKGEAPALRVAETLIDEIHLEHNIRLRTIHLEEIEDLPEEQHNVLYVVSMATAERAWKLERRDFVAPDSGSDRITFKLPNGQDGTFAVRGLRFIVG